MTNRPTSLLYFHIVLMFSAVMLSMLLGFWGIISFMNSKQMADFTMGVSGFIVAVLLIVYLVWFIIKKQDQL